MYQHFNTWKYQTSGPTYEFAEGDYTGNEATGMPITVTVRQVVSSVQDIHLLLVPLTYAEYTARAATDPTLADIDVYHRSRPDAAESKTLIIIVIGLRVKFIGFSRQ